MRTRQRGIAKERCRDVQACRSRSPPEVRTKPAYARRTRQVPAITSSCTGCAARRRRPGRAPSGVGILVGLASITFSLYKVDYQSRLWLRASVECAVGTFPGSFVALTEHQRRDLSVSQLIRGLTGVPLLPIRHAALRQIFRQAFQTLPDAPNALLPATQTVANRRITRVS
jgi:hypothetical protein